jgi:hypothetical protein
MARKGVLGVSHNSGTAGVEKVGKQGARLVGGVYRIGFILVVLACESGFSMLYFWGYWALEQYLCPDGYFFSSGCFTWWSESLFAVAITLLAGGLLTTNIMIIGRLYGPRAVKWLSLVIVVATVLLVLRLESPAGRLACLVGGIGMMACYGLVFLKERSRSRV